MTEVYRKEHTTPETNWGNELCDLVMTENNAFFKAAYRSHFNLYFLVFLKKLNTQEDRKLDKVKVITEFYVFLEKAEINHGYQAICELFEENDQMELFNESSLCIDFQKPQEVQWTINHEKNDYTNCKIHFG